MRNNSVKLLVLALAMVAFFVQAQDAVTIMDIQGTDQFSTFDGQTGIDTNANIVIVLAI